MPKTKFVVLIPLYYNDGKKVPRSVLNEICHEFYLLAGGYTLAGKVTGAYRMKDGSKQVDQSASVWVVIEDEREPSLRKLVAEICSQLDQEAIYLERSGGTVEFVAPSSGASQ